MSQRRFEAAYALAFFGVFCGFLPLLVLLLPRRVEAVAGANDPLFLLSILLLVGALMASGAHIVAGTISDGWLQRHGGRRGPMLVGLAALVGAYAIFANAASFLALLFGILLHQFSLNMVFAPLGALLADYVPDARKGHVSGLLNLALPLSGLATAGLGTLSTRDADWPFTLVAFVVVLCMAPLLVTWRRLVPPLLPRDDARAPDSPLALLRGDFAKAFIARALVQLGAASLLTYLFLYVDRVAREAGGFPSFTSSEGVALLALVGNLLALGAAPYAGRFSDRLAKRKAPLVACVLVGGAALAILAAAPGWTAILLAYAVFSVALAAFLAIDGALIATIVADSPKRGALLGVMNLTNTIPAIVAPLLALALSQASFGGETLRLLLAVAAAGMAVAAIPLMRLRSVT